MNVEQIKKVENRILELKSQSLSLSDRQIKFEKILDKKNPKSIYNKREEYDNDESWEKDIEWYDSEFENSIPLELSKINQWTVWLIELLEQNEIVTQKIENLTNQLLNYKCFGNEENYKKEFSSLNQHLIDELNYWISLKNKLDKKIKK